MLMAAFVEGLIFAYNNVWIKYKLFSDSLAWSSSDLKKMDLLEHYLVYQKLLQQRIQTFVNHGSFLSFTFIMSYPYQINVGL